MSVWPNANRGTANRWDGAYDAVRTVVLIVCSATLGLGRKIVPFLYLRSDSIERHPCVFKTPRIWVLVSNSLPSAARGDRAEVDADGRPAEQLGRVVGGVSEEEEFPVAARPVAHRERDPGLDADAHAGVCDLLVKVIRFGDELPERIRHGDGDAFGLVVVGLVGDQVGAVVLRVDAVDVGDDEHRRMEHALEDVEVA